MHTYQYDAEGRLISVDDGSSGTYVYNGLGLWVGGGGGSMLYNPFGQWIADGDSSGTLSVQLVPGPGNPHMVMDAPRIIKGRPFRSRLLVLSSEPTSEERSTR